MITERMQQLAGVPLHEDDEPDGKYNAGIQKIGKKFVAIAKKYKATNIYLFYNDDGLRDASTLNITGDIGRGDFEVTYDLENQIFWGGLTGLHHKDKKVSPAAAAKAFEEAMKEVKEYNDE